MTDESVQSGLYGALPGWSPLCAPNDWSPTINTNKGEPLFEDVDNPGGWSSYTIRPMFEPRGGKYICHAMPAGIVPVPINAETGKREEGGYEFFYQEWKQNYQKLERIADLVQPGKIYSLQIERLNWN